MHTRNMSRPGSAFVYTTIVLGLVLLPMATLAIDFGRISTARQQMQDTADAAALAAANVASGPKTVARELALSIAAQNKVVGEAGELARGDIVFGRWDATTRTFEELPDNDPRIQAVRIVMRKSGELNGGPMAILFGARDQEIVVESIAGFVDSVNNKTVVASTSNPWLAGMPGGTYASWMRTGSAREYAEQFEGWTVRRDRADDGSGLANESPVAVQDVPIVPGQTVWFDSIGGEMNHSRFTPDAQSSMHQPDGQEKLTWNMYPSHDPTSLPVHDGYDNDTDDYQYADQRDTPIGQDVFDDIGEHGKSNVLAPHDALVGVFLTDATPINGEARPGRTGASGPDGWDVPDALDFSSAASRDFDKLEPKIGQVFYIGDGANSAGNRQNFIVPEGATRLFLGTTDGWEWNNNGGAFETTIYRPAQVFLVH